MPKPVKASVYHYLDAVIAGVQLLAVLLIRGEGARGERSAGVGGLENGVDGQRQAHDDMIAVAALDSSDT